MVFKDRNDQGLKHMVRGLRSHAKLRRCQLVNATMIMLDLEQEVQRSGALLECSLRQATPRSASKAKSVAVPYTVHTMQITSQAAVECLRWALCEAAPLRICTIPGPFGIAFPLPYSESSESRELCENKVCLFQGLLALTAYCCCRGGVAR